METPLSTTALPAPPPPLRPMSMGEILDRALQLFRSNFGRLLTTMLVFQAPIYALTKGLQFFLREKAPILARPGAYRGELVSPEQLAWALLGIFVTLGGSVLIYQLAVAASASAASRAYLGERVEVAHALGDSMRRAPQVLGTYAVVFLWMSLLVGLAALPGFGLGIAGVAFASSPTTRLVLAGVGVLLGFGLGLVALLYVMLRYTLVTEVVVLERRSFVGAIRRAAQLMAGRVGPGFFDNCKVRASIVLAVNLAISLSVMVVTSLPSLVVNSAFGISPLNPESYDPAVVPLWASVPVELFAVVTQAAVAPFGLLAMVVFYFDIRIKREGFDLEFLASRLGARR